MYMKYLIIALCADGTTSLIDTTSPHNAIIKSSYTSKRISQQLPHELEYNPHNIIYIFYVLFYLITLRNFIIKIQILYFISKHVQNNFCKRDLLYENNVNCI
jgi:hypothetical protein